MNPPLYLLSIQIKDFTFKRKHLFGNTLINVLLPEGGSLKDELYKLFGYNLDTPTVSSFIQKKRQDSSRFHTLFNFFLTTELVKLNYPRAN